MKFMFFLFLLMLAAAPARADINNPELYFRSATVTTSSAEILPADNARRMLILHNVCASNVGVKPGANAEIGTTGTMTLLPGGSVTFTGADVPKNAIHGISASGSCDITVWGLR